MISAHRNGLLAAAVTVAIRAGWRFRRIVRAAGARLAGSVTPLGWSVAALAPLVLHVGYRLALIELIVVGYSALTLILVAVVSLLGSTAVSIELVLIQARVVVGVPAEVALVVTNTGARRSAAMLIAVPITAASGQQTIVEIRLPSMARAGLFRTELAIPSCRRGVYQLGPPRSVRADPVGLLRRNVVWGAGGEVRVHPKTLVFANADAGLLRDLEGRASRVITQSDVSFHSVREYVPGDARRNIHWKSSAKTDTPMVRQFDETRRTRLVVALSLATTDYLDDEEFELAVSCAGSLGLRALRAAGEVEVIVGRSAPHFAQRPAAGIRMLDSRAPVALLNDLAELETSTLCPDLRFLAALTATRTEPVSVAYLVCGAAVVPAELRAAAAKFPSGTEVIVVVCDLEAIPERRFLEGVTVFIIGSLDDLRISMTGVVSL